jgi:lipoate-protein ligase B
LNPEIHRAFDALYRGRSLEVYLLPKVSWEVGYALQQRLVFEISSEPTTRAALVLVEYEPQISIGRQGSREHLLIDEDRLRQQEIEIRWTNRGGGVWCHGPGQLMINLIFPVRPPAFPDRSSSIIRGFAFNEQLNDDGEDRLPTIERVATGLRRSILKLLDRIKTPGRIEAAAGVTVNDRPIAAIGMSVRTNATYHGAFLNVNPNPSSFKWATPIPRSPRLATSLFREFRTQIRMPAIREQLTEIIAREYGFGDVLICDPPVGFTSVKKRGSMGVSIGSKRGDFRSS